MIAGQIRYPFYRFGKRDILKFPDKRENIPAGAAYKAFEDLLFLGYVKRRIMVIVKRTFAAVFLSASVQRYKMIDHIDNVGF